MPAPHETTSDDDDGAFSWCLGLRDAVGPSRGLTALTEIDVGQPQPRDVRGGGGGGSGGSDDEDDGSSTRRQKDSKDLVVVTNNLDIRHSNHISYRISESQRREGGRCRRRTLRRTQGTPALAEIESQQRWDRQVSATWDSLAYGVQQHDRICWIVGFVTLVLPGTPVST